MICHKAVLLICQCTHMSSGSLGKGRFQVAGLDGAQASAFVTTRRWCPCRWAQDHTLVRLQRGLCYHGISPLSILSTVFGNWWLPKKSPNQAIRRWDVTFLCWTSRPMRGSLGWVSSCRECKDQGFEGRKVLWSSEILAESEKTAIESHSCHLSCLGK